MAHTLSPETKSHLEEIRSRAEPYSENDPLYQAIFETFGGGAFDNMDGYDEDREMSTIAKLMLEGKL